MLSYFPEKPHQKFPPYRTATLGRIHFSHFLQRACIFPLEKTKHGSERKMKGKVRRAELIQHILRKGNYFLSRCRFSHRHFSAENVIHVERVDNRMLLGAFTYATSTSTSPATATSSVAPLSGSVQVIYMQVKRVANFM